MPNIITHKIFAEEVLKSMTKHDIRSMIERHPQIFYIGSNGPDFLFFSHIKPWESYKSHALNRLGSAMHAHGINAFYETAIECIRAQKHEEGADECLSVWSPVSLGAGQDNTSLYFLSYRELPGCQCRSASPL